ncbi:hypothetical protein M5K25_019468 [Dendrobium thyrsiflorum]|uniref:Uncharacterized protein n=1 Tax=Dendrobium thyrsiflorum TaxID=117978 RepID=A0ABD0UF87_DENTH
MDNYVDRVLFTLVPSIEEHLPTGHWRIIGRPSNSPSPATSPTTNTLGITCLLCLPMDPEQIQRTVDLILGQLGTVTQQIRETQGELADFKRQAGERLDNIDRLGNPVIYTPFRPHSSYMDMNVIIKPHVYLNHNFLRTSREVKLISIDNQGSQLKKPKKRKEKGGHANRKFALRFFHFVIGTSFKTKGRIGREPKLCKTLSPKYQTITKR